MIFTSELSIHYELIALIMDLYIVVLSSPPGGMKNSSYLLANDK